MPDRGSLEGLLGRGGGLRPYQVGQGGVGAIGTKLRCPWLSERRTIRNTDLPRRQRSVHPTETSKPCVKRGPCLEVERQLRFILKRYIYGPVKGQRRGSFLPSCLIL